MTNPRSDCTGQLDGTVHNLLRVVCEGKVGIFQGFVNASNSSHSCTRKCLVDTQYERNKKIKCYFGRSHVLSITLDSCPVYVSEEKRKEKEIMNAVVSTLDFRNIV